LLARPLDVANPLADWSAHLFPVGRSRYLLLTHTKSFFSTVAPAKGGTASADKLVDRVRSALRDLLAAAGYGSAYERFIDPAAAGGGAAAVSFARALDRRVVGTMNDQVYQAQVFLTDLPLPLPEVAWRLNETPYSALGYGSPAKAFEAMVKGAGACGGSTQRKE
jgi:hypothetical protein